MSNKKLTDESSSELPKIIYDKMVDSIYLIDPQTSNIIWVNKAGHESLQMPENEVLNNSVLSLQKDVIGQEQWKSIAAVIRQTKNFTFMGRHVRKDGSTFPVEVNTSCFEEDGKEYFLSVARDISSRRAQEAEGQGRDQQIWLALNACTDGLWDWEVQTGSVYFSPQLKRLLGYGPDEMKPILETWENNVHPDDLPMVIQALEGHIKGQRERYEAVYRIKNRNGHFLWVHDLGIVSEHSNNGEVLRVTGMVKDITEYKIQEFRLLELAAYDDLTELRNRRECSRVFDKQLELANRSKQPLSIALFDLDFFKTVNDKYGHMAGDAVLKGVATLFTQSLRKSDYLFRWGGEEFVLLSVNTSIEEMKVLTEKLRILLEKNITTYKDCQISITGSFGLASYPLHAESQNDLFLIADSALYKAKSQGRNCISLPD